jgi:hypothetical protein
MARIGKMEAYTLEDTMVTGRLKGKSMSYNLIKLTRSSMSSMKEDTNRL